MEAFQWWGAVRFWFGAEKRGCSVDSSRSGSGGVSSDGDRAEPAPQERARGPRGARQRGREEGLRASRKAGGRVVGPDGPA